MNVTQTKKDARVELKKWVEIMNANRSGQTPDSHAAYEEAVWNIRRITREQIGAQQ